MKIAKIFFPLFSLLLLSFSCTNNHENKKETIVETDNQILDSNTLYVLYFHSNIRCETCVAVDENTNTIVYENFYDKVKKGKIVFKSINIDEQGNEKLIEKYKIWGQTLLFIKGNNVVNKTTEAFMNVTTAPEKWEKIVIETINKVLK